MTYKYIKAHLRLSLIHDAPSIKIVTTFTDFKNKEFMDEDIYAYESFEKEYLPLIKIVLKIDSISSALLYLSTVHSEENIWTRIIKDGTDWITIEGINFNEDGSNYFIQSESQENAYYSPSDLEKALQYELLKIRRIRNEV